MRTLVSLSGGIDSTTIIAKLLDENKTKVIPIGFAYPSKHNTLELKAARQVCEYYNLHLHIINITSLFTDFKSNLMLGQGGIPRGHYTDDTMKATVVPARNLIFASILTGYAISQEIDSIALGVHAGDHTIYKDCRPGFIDALQKAIYAIADIEIYTPFLRDSKIDIVREGLILSAPYHLTRTCYTMDLEACGKCGSCIERLEAFQCNGAKDPIIYAKKEETNIE